MRDRREFRYIEKMGGGGGGYHGDQRDYGD